MPTCTRERACERANKQVPKYTFHTPGRKVRKEGRSAIFQAIFEVLFFFL